MVTIAYRCLRHLGDQTLGIAKQEMHHGSAPLEFLQHETSRYPKTLASTLDECPARRRATAHDKWQTDNAFVPDDRDLRRGAAVHHVQERNNRRGWKVHMRHFTTGFVDHRAKRHVRGFKIR